MNLFLLIGSQFHNVNYGDPHTLKQVVATEAIDLWKRSVTASQSLFPQLEEQFRRHLSPVDR
jgi:hypothetical protein